MLKYYVWTKYSNIGPICYSLQTFCIVIEIVMHDRVYFYFFADSPIYTGLFADLRHNRAGVGII